MTRVFVALAVSVDGYITGRDTGADCGLGDGAMLFDWYFDGDTASEISKVCVSVSPVPASLHQVPVPDAPA